MLFVVRRYNVVYGFSQPALAFSQQQRGVAAVLVPLDEQSPHARDSAALRHPPVGHVSGQSTSYWIFSK